MTPETTTQDIFIISENVRLQFKDSVFNLPAELLEFILREREKQIDSIGEENIIS